MVVGASVLVVVDSIEGKGASVVGAHGSTGGICALRPLADRASAGGFEEGGDTVDVVVVGGIVVVVGGTVVVVGGGVVGGGVVGGGVVGGGVVGGSVVGGTVVVVDDDVVDDDVVVEAHGSTVGGVCAATGANHKTTSTRAATMHASRARGDCGEDR